MIYLIIGAIGIILLAVLLFKLIKNVFKVIVTLVGILVVLSLVFSVVVFTDVKDITEGMQNQEKLFLFEHDGEFVTGFSGISLENVSFLNEEKLGEYNTKNDDLDYLLGESFNLFIINSDAFEDIDKIKFEDNDLSKKEAFELIESTDLGDELGLEGSDKEIKGAIFAVLLGESIERDKLFIFKQFKEGNLVVYPETITFKIIENIPMSLVDNLISKIKKGGDHGIF